MGAVESVMWSRWLCLHYLLVSGQCWGVSQSQFSLYLMTGKVTKGPAAQSCWDLHVWKQCTLQRFIFWMHQSNIKLLLSWWWASLRSYCKIIRNCSKWLCYVQRKVWFSRWLPDIKYRIGLLSFYCFESILEVTKLQPTPDEPLTINLSESSLCMNVPCIT